MEEFGLLDAVTAMTGLSGSTWAMAAWYAGGKSLVDTRARLAETLSAPFYTNKLWPDTVKSHVKERMGFDQELGLVDVMGWHLYNVRPKTAERSKKEIESALSGASLGRRLAQLAHSPLCFVSFPLRGCACFSSTCSRIFP